MGFPRFSPFLTKLCVCAAALVATTASQAIAQDAPPPAQIAVVDGAATLTREDQIQEAVPGTPFLPGDQLRTTSGRVELLFPDGSAIDVDEYAAVDLQSLEAPTLLRLTAGRLLLTVTGVADPARADAFQIDTPAGAVLTEGPGEYRVSLRSGPEVELAVLRGSASLWNEQAAARVGAGERSLARAYGPPSAPLRFNSARFDAFDQWSAARRDERAGVTSAQYLPSNLRVYGSAFDRYGAWQYEAPYGQVWYPTVAPDWRPYYRGYWSPLRTYGWTWIGVDVWSWPTHHYGRWGHTRDRWFWIPDRRWAPAWVTWASAPGYVSWCPLGFDGRPVFALTVGTAPRAGWVVLPRAHFGARGSYVDRFAVPGNRLSVRTTFAVVPTAPVAPPRAVARGGASRSAWTASAAPRRAVPRADLRGLNAAPSATGGASAPPTDRSRLRAGDGRVAGAPAADRARARTGAVSPAAPPADGDRSRTTAPAPETPAPRSTGGRLLPPSYRSEAPASRAGRVAPAIPRAVPRANRDAASAPAAGTPTSPRADAPSPSQSMPSRARPRSAAPVAPSSAPEARSVPADAPPRSRQFDAPRPAPSTASPSPAREDAPGPRRAGAPARAAAPPAGRAAPDRPASDATPSSGRRAAPRNEGAAQPSGDTQPRAQSREGAGRAAPAARRRR